MARRNELHIRHPWVVAFAFDLLHGFGFASALTSAGLPRYELPLTLVSFNVGVELGQLGFIALVLLLERSFCILEVRWPRWAQAIPGYTVGSLSAFWTVFCKARGDSRFRTEWGRDETLFTRRNRGDAEGSIRAVGDCCGDRSFYWVALGNCEGSRGNPTSLRKTKARSVASTVTRSVWRNTIGDPKTAKSKAPVPVIPQLAKRLDVHRKSV